MAEYQFTWNEEEFSYEFRSADGMVAQDLQKRALLVHALAREYTTGLGGGPQIRTGDLHNTLFWELGSDGMGAYAVVGSPMNYAGYVELGHAIRGRHTTARYYKKGRLKYVRRRGRAIGRVPPYPFLRPALKAARVSSGIAAIGGGQSVRGPSGRFIGSL